MHFLGTEGEGEGKTNVVKLIRLVALVRVSNEPSFPAMPIRVAALQEQTLDVFGRVP